MNIRPANMVDAEILFQWRNDPTTREMSKARDPVSWDGHVSWLSARLSRPEPNLFIAEQGSHAVATYRIDGDEISYTVAPWHRGKGVAGEMLALAVQRHGPLVAEIYPRNTASIRAASAAGIAVHFLEEETV